MMIVSLFRRDEDVEGREAEISSEIQYLDSGISEVAMGSTSLLLMFLSLRSASSASILGTVGPMWNLYLCIAEQRAQTQ